jgi:glyoxylase-like metal-dependent hydrolase (beta-lactamase superfamily II)
MHHEVDNCRDDTDGEDRQREEVIQRIKARVIGKGLWFLFGHDGGSWRGRASVTEGQFLVLGSQFSVPGAKGWVFLRTKN